MTTAATVGTTRHEVPELNSFVSEGTLPEVPPLPTFAGEDSIISTHDSSGATSNNTSLLSVPLAAAAATADSQRTAMIEAAPSVSVEPVAVAPPLPPAGAELQTTAEVEDSAAGTTFSECSSSLVIAGTSPLSVPSAGTASSALMESQQTTTEDSALSDYHSSFATSSTSLLSIPPNRTAPPAVVAELPPTAAPPAVMVPQGTNEDKVLHPALGKKVQPVFDTAFATSTTSEARSAQASPMSTGGNEDLAAALRSALAQVVEEAKACLVAEQKAEDSCAEADNEEVSCFEAEHEATNSADQADPQTTRSAGDSAMLDDKGLSFISAVECVTDTAEVKHLRNFAVGDDCLSTECTVSVPTATTTTPTNADAAASTARTTPTNADVAAATAAAPAEPEAASEAEADEPAEVATDGCESTLEVEAAQEIQQPLGDLHSLGSTASCHVDCDMAGDSKEDESPKLELVAEVPENLAASCLQTCEEDAETPEVPENLAASCLQTCEEDAETPEARSHRNGEQHCSPCRASIVPAEDREEHSSPHQSNIAPLEDPQDCEEHCSVMQLMTPERGADAKREAELACPVTCHDVHEVEHEVAPETAGLTSKTAKSSRRDSMTLVAFDLAQPAKETEPVRCNAAPRRVSVTWMLRRGWRSTGGGALPVRATTPPRLRQPVQSRRRNQHDGSAQANHRSDHTEDALRPKASVSSVAQNAAFVLLGATCAMATMVELAWRLGPDPEPFS